MPGNVESSPARYPGVYGNWAYLGIQKGGGPSGHRVFERYRTTWILVSTFLENLSETEEGIQPPSVYRESRLTGNGYEERASGAHQQSRERSRRNVFLIISAMIGTNIT